MSFSEDRPHRRSSLEWGLPAWIAIASFLLFVLCDRVVSHHSELLTWIMQQADADFWKIILGSLLVTGAGFPLGFVIYQLYFYIRWSSPISGDGVAPVVIGRKRELLAILDGLGKTQLDKLLPNCDQHDHKTMWRKMVPHLRKALAHGDTSGRLLSLERQLLDIIHALGAGYLGMVMGYVAYLTLARKMASAHPLWLFVPVTIATVTVMLLVIEEHCSETSIMNQAKRRSAEADVENQQQQNKSPAKQKKIHWEDLTIYLPELFLTFIAVLFLGLNADTTTRELYRNLTYLLLFGGIMWTIFADKAQWRIFLSFSIPFFVAQNSSLQEFMSQVSTSNWAVVFSTIVFSALSVAFLKNRNNTIQTIIHIFQSHLKEYADSLPE